MAYYRGRGSSHVVSGLDTLNFSLIRAASNLLIQPSRYIFEPLPFLRSSHCKPLIMTELLLLEVVLLGELLGRSQQPRHS